MNGTWTHPVISTGLCPACAGKIRPCFEVDCAGRRMAVSRCDACDSYVKDPFFDPAELAEIYRHYAIHESHYTPARGEIDSLIAKIRRIERHAPGRGELLEIGCGRGFLLAEAAKRGWRAGGLEIEGSARQHLLPELARSVAFIPSEEGFGTIDPGRYDVICSYQVLEHLRTPAAAFARWTAGLRPGGLLVVDTPNAGSLGARIHRAAWIQQARPEHFVLFTVRALRRLCRMNGLRILHAHYGGAPALCSGSASVATSVRKVFRFRSLAGAARSLVHRLGLGDNIEILARKG
jgi:2-polyprenyl-3-methyl-5-hydroxy-6-metoxy-1,4-benzoquinol methylase